jgi:NAD(P)-dependent dehydrogenase (short-subunit alcohol dehydrogenase family)
MVREVAGARALVVGAGGVLGGALTRALHEAGARCVGTARDPGRLAGLGDAVESAVALDVLDVAACRQAVAAAAERLGGLDLVVVATGVAAFGTVSETPDEVAEELFAVNTLGPMAVVSEAVTQMPDGGSLVVLSAILADVPMAGMAAYSASKAGLSAYLSAVRKEVRRQGIGVLDVRPPHLETGLADRALHGTSPRLPAGHPVDDLVALVVEGIRSGAQELVWDPSTRALALR